VKHAALFLACACGTAVGGDAPAARRDPIWYGVPAPDDHAVFSIHDDVSACTAALIAPRTLLTARHCVNQGTVIATNRPSSTEQYMGLETQKYVEAYPDGGNLDLALVFLDRAPPITPLPWDFALAAPPPGLTVRHIGYGATEDGGGGERKTVLTTTGLMLFDPASGQLVLSGTPTAGVCFGDSGGPMLHVEPGGGERLLGVNVRLAGATCGPVASVVIPRYRDFLAQWLEAHEDGGCGYDRRCVPGCTPTDWDCVCSADGQCTAACPDLDDADCPADCRTNRRCSSAPCPRPDTDCTPEGEPCLTELQCAGRRCLGDPQHEGTYCSSPCDAGCTAGFQCDATRGACIKAQLPEAALGEPCTAAGTWCLSGVCLDGACRTPCVQDSECADAGHFCRAPQPRYCAPSTLLPQLEATLPRAPGGCSAAPAGALALAGLAALRRRLRKPRG